MSEVGTRLTEREQAKLRGTVRDVRTRAEMIEKDLRMAISHGNVDAVRLEYALMLLDTAMMVATKGLMAELPDAH